jgi:hypothetical protein
MSPVHQAEHIRSPRPLLSQGRLLGGIDRPSRPPLMMSIELTAQEPRDLIASMELLSGAYE